MRFNLTKEEMHDHLKVKKAALISIAINVLEIVAGIVMLTLVRRMLLGGVEESIVRMVSLLCFTIVGWGALIGYRRVADQPAHGAPHAGAGGSVFTARRPQPRDARPAARLL